MTTAVVTRHHHTVIVVDALFAVFTRQVGMPQLPNAPVPAIAMQGERVDPPGRR